MADEEYVRLRPRDLATVWGTAFGQLIDLARTTWVAILEAGAGEENIQGGHCNPIIVPLSVGRPPRLAAPNLVGESFGKSLPSQSVKFTDGGSAADPGRIMVNCCVDESQGQPIQGDIYRGDVVDDGGNWVATIALDAGS